MNNQKENHRPLAIDLFAGCGGMSLGIEAAGFDIVASVEIDPIHCLIHHFNFPYSITICQDISKVDSKDILEKIKAKGFYQNIDLITGGPPCQGFSLMGKRQLDDPRNHLVFEYLRIIKEIKPKYFLFENVPGIGKGKHRKFLEELIDLFWQNGYDIVQPFLILDAANFGAPQSRKRLILIGYRQDVPKPKYPESNYGNSPHNPACQPLTTVKDVLADLGDIPVFTDIDRGINTYKLNYQGFRANYALSSENRFRLCHRRQTNGKIWGHIGSKHQPQSIKRFQETLPGKVEKISRFFKLSTDGLSNTLRAGTTSNKGAFTAPRPIHYQHPRCITVREAARLHGFPDWFQFHRTIWHGFREIGNAVVPFLAQSLGEEIIKCLEIDTKQSQIRDLDYVDEKILSFNISQACKYWNVPDDIIAKRRRTK
jgi:DNA (cytosine-5)-methyltransferase 1